MQGDLRGLGFCAVFTAQRRGENEEQGSSTYRRIVVLYVIGPHFASSTVIAPHFSPSSRRIDESTFDDACSVQCAHDMPKPREGSVARASAPPALLVVTTYMRVPSQFVVHTYILCLSARTIRTYPYAYDSSRQTPPSDERIRARLSSYTNLLPGSLTRLPGITRLGQHYS